MKPLLGDPPGLIKGKQLVLHCGERFQSFNLGFHVISFQSLQCLLLVINLFFVLLLGHLLVVPASTRHEGVLS